MIDPTFAAVVVVAIVAVVAIAPGDGKRKPPAQALLTALVELVKMLVK